MRLLLSTVLVGFVAACATGETPEADIMPPLETGGGSAGSESGGSFASGGTVGSGAGATAPVAGSFSSGGQVTGGTFTGGGFGTSGAGVTAGADTGGGGAGTGGASAGAGGKASGGTGGKATGGAGTGGAPPNGTCGQSPLSAKNTWVASASVHADNCPTPDDTGDYCAPPNRGIDGVATNRYSTGAARTGTDWYQIDFGKDVAVSRVVLNTAAGSGDYTLAYEVRMSSNAGDIAASTVLASGAGQKGATTINLPATKVARYLRINQTMAMAGWWSLAEVDVSCQ